MQIYHSKNYKTQSKYMELKTIEYLKENKIEFYLCKICGQIVDKNHFDTQEHIDKFNDVCKIDIKKCFENVFLTINSSLLCYCRIHYAARFICLDSE